VVATIRDNELAAYDQARLTGTAGGVERGAVDLLAQVSGRRRLSVAQHLSRAERGNADAYRTSDARIECAVRAAEGFAEYLAAGTAMMDYWSTVTGRSSRLAKRSLVLPSIVVVLAITNRSQLRRSQGSMSAVFHVAGRAAPTYRLSKRGSSGPVAQCWVQAPAFRPAPIRPTSPPIPARSWHWERSDRSSCHRGRGSPGPRRRRCGRAVLAQSGGFRLQVGSLDLSAFVVEPDDLGGAALRVEHFITAASAGGDHDLGSGQPRSSTNRSEAQRSRGAGIDAGQRVHADTGDRRRSGRSGRSRHRVDDRAGCCMQPAGPSGYRVCPDNRCLLVFDG
jgi:hypothetical protein